MDHYDGYNYKKFKELALDDNVSVYEKIGFPESYRKGKESIILDDIISKVPLIKEKKGLVILDIGPGCSELQKRISGICQEQEHRLFLSDSGEMLSLIDDNGFSSRIPGFFPKTFDAVLEKSGGIDVIICYSLFHYIFVDGNVWEFLDKVMMLLKDGGQAIVGDIPNNSKRKRYFASPNGIKYHQEFMKTSEVPVVHFNGIEENKIDESLLLAAIMKCNNSGFDAYLVPQGKALPFANRRDDLLIRRP